ncbi:Uncharacterize protein [Babesia sp. Xinjiang]|uniref:Uncharacterize protein n=1 Tax=Babesia sp. Xinjiang TaxID=462227 RepID=UPI000A21BC1B|nr:Uncharacterize protein [Babesia sp. Xinjiang]XP_028872598.1 Uncharacterize protein [Babesia sp. Xinjiang]ORM42113.1 Uncharacterize protein [Babesia sp. Xinjiang]ORM42142.1 Uncharacterize protein [Babesia sp. Xinjiang]
MYKKGDQQGSYRTSKSSSDSFSFLLRNNDFTSANERRRASLPAPDSLEVFNASRTGEDITNVAAENHRGRHLGRDTLNTSGNHSNYGSGEPRQSMRNTIRDNQSRDSTRGNDYQRWQDRECLRITNSSSSHVTMERRGGLTWIKSPNGLLVPCIENTWLKHMITTLLGDSKALSKFFKTLQQCLEEAVLFLYREGIKPYLGDVANQMKRSIADNFWSASEVAFVSLHCRDTVDLKIELRVKGEMGWVVYLRNDPPGFLGFVDTHSTVDTYSNYHWRALNKFAVEIMTSDNAPVRSDSEEHENPLAFAGGRYAFAERLRERVYAFRSMRLGEVVHLVQLAIYSGVFVYAQRILLPVTACEKTAEEMFPRVKRVRHPICSSLEEVRRIVSLLVDHRKNGLVLAQLKQQFMMQFNKELNPITFGFRKLQNLLLSDYFNRQYQLFVPIDSPHRTHIQHRKYTIPVGCRPFQQSKIHFDADKFWSPLDEWYDEPCDALNDLPANILAALEDVLDGDEGYACKRVHHYSSLTDECSIDDDTSTDAPASNCVSGRGMTYRNAVVGIGAPSASTFEEDPYRSKSI